MKRVLITGMSGTGKTTLLAEFAARGYRIVDTDYGDYYETVGGERLWREDRIDALLSSAPDELPGVLFVQGTTRNQGLFYPRFDHIVLLSAPADVLVERLATRGTNPYGKDPAELAEALDNLRTVEPLLRASATLEVVTTVPVAHVAGIVLAHVLLPRFGRQRLMAGDTNPVERVDRNDHPLTSSISRWSTPASIAAFSTSACRLSTC